MKKVIILFLAVGFVGCLIILPTNTADAGCCGCDPVYEYSKVMKVKSAVWVRNEACVATGDIIDTLKTGEVVQVTHKTDGWFKVKSPRGFVGWSGEQFLVSTSEPLTGTTTVAPKPTTVTPTTISSETNTSLSRLKGYILLQVEANGEAHYYYPENNKRYYLGRPADAFGIMRELGLGIKHTELKSYLGYKFPARLSGKILLDVEMNGEAYYIYPKDLKGYYLGRPEDAFAIMREKGLGITNTNLDLISSSNVSTFSTPTNTTPSTTTPTSNPGTTSVNQIPVSSDLSSTAQFISSGSQVAGDGSFQIGSVPSGLNYATINEAFLARVNYERTKRGKPAIISDQRMVDTASVWAYEMYKQGQMTHTRVPVNMMARVWVWDNFKIEYRESWGWLYENIGGGSYNRSQGINESIMSSMESLLDYFISEESYNGIHFQTIMHDHLTHTGVGFYFEGNNDSGTLWTVMHYGGLFNQVQVIDRVL